MRSFDQLHVAIVGAGLSGVACARRLSQSGIRSMVFDRGYTPGGRLSSRVVELGDASFDFNHGAPLIHAVTDDFQRELQSWVDAGVASWADKPHAVAGIPRTQAILQHLADGLTISSSHEVRSIQRSEDHWDLFAKKFDESEPRCYQFDSVLFACPGVQANRVLSASPLSLADQCPDLASSTRWVCMLILEDSSGLFSGSSHIRADLQHGVESLRVDDRHGDHVAIVATMNQEWSNTHQSFTKEDALPLLVEAASETICTHLHHKNLHVLHARAHRWGLARATAWVKQACQYDPDSRLGFSGDWFSGPQGRWRDAEAAYLSGLSLAEAVVGN